MFVPLKELSVKAEAEQSEQRLKISGLNKAAMGLPACCPDSCENKPLSPTLALIMPSQISSQAFLDEVSGFYSCGYYRKRLSVILLNQLGAHGIQILWNTLFTSGLNLGYTS